MSLARSFGSHAVLHSSFSSSLDACRAAQEAALTFARKLQVPAKGRLLHHLHVGRWKRAMELCTMLRDRTKSGDLASLESLILRCLETAASLGKKSKWPAILVR